MVAPPVVVGPSLHERLAADLGWRPGAQSQPPGARCWSPVLIHHILHGVHCGHTAEYVIVESGGSPKTLMSFQGGVEEYAHALLKEKNQSATVTRLPSVLSSL